MRRKELPFSPKGMRLIAKTISGDVECKALVNAVMRGPGSPDEKREKAAVIRENQRSIRAERQDYVKREMRV